MPTKSKIQDQTFLFTGTLTEFTRDEAEALVEAHGGKVLSGVSAKLNYLVVGEDAGSKLAKAKALKTVAIITEKEFLKMVPRGKSVATKKATKEKTKPVVTNASAKKVASETTIEEVKIGNQIWMAENLDVAHFRNGDPIPEAITIQDFVDASSNCQPIQGFYSLGGGDRNSFGRLYNWYAVNDKRGVAPIDWSVPSKEDWDELSMTCNENASVLKSKVGWSKKGNGTNNTGFNALPAGDFDDFESKLIDLNDYAYWWTSTEWNDGTAHYVRMSNEDHEIFREVLNKGFAFSIRCVRKKGQVISGQKLLLKKKGAFSRTIGNSENQILHNSIKWSNKISNAAKDYFIVANDSSLYLFENGGPFSAKPDVYFSSEFFDLFNADVMFFILNLKIEGEIEIMYSKSPTEFIIDEYGKLNKNLTVKLSLTKEHLSIDLEREHFYDYDDVEDEKMIKRILKIKKNDASNKIWSTLILSKNFDVSQIESMLTNHFSVRDLVF